MSASYPDKSLDALRSLVNVIDREIASKETSAELQKAWTDMVAILALGPSPQTRTCPTCNEVGMRAATRCSRCWRSLPALPPLT